MATTTDTFAQTVALTQFERPETLSTSPAALVTPFGEGIGSLEAAVIGAVGAADTNVVTISLTLPTGWFYRLVELTIQTAGTSITDMNEPQSFMAGLITENQVVNKRFLVSNLTNQYSSVDAAGALAIRAGYHGVNPTTTNDFLAVYGIDSRFQKGFRDDLIDASQGVSIVQLTWLNDSSAATGAMGLSLYSRFLMYSIEQARHGALWIPSL